MAGVAVTVLLDHLSRLRKHHAYLDSGIDEHLELLQIELSVWKEFLLKHDDEEDEALREVREDIKKCVYDVEDAIDGYLTQMAESKVKITDIKTILDTVIKELKAVTENRLPAGYRYIFKKRNPKGIPGARVLMTTKLESNQNPENMENVQQSTDSHFQPRLPPTHIHNVMMGRDVEVDNVMMGRDVEEETIISYLMKSSDKLGVISIEGEAGLGKTTLARRIYVNTKIAYEFPIRIWICVSKYNVSHDNILRDILRVFTSQDIDSLSREKLSENVLACLEKKTFLLVLDDVQHQNIWKAIQNILSKSDGMGKVLITSRFFGVEHANSNVRLDRLLTKDSWELLQLQLFGDLKRCPPQLEGIGRAIADKCWGKPLTIILVGRILMWQLMNSNISDPIKDVLEVYQNVHKDLGPQMMDPSDLLQSAYNRLSDELRRCFLYMGVFPKDYEISASTLTLLWIAEGFVRPMEGHRLEEVATQNLDDLIRMGLVMVAKTNPFGKVKTCRVHGIILSSFILHKAKEQGLLGLSLGHYGCRRLCVHSVENTLLPATQTKISGVRSVLCFNESPTGLDQNHILPILNTSNLLKVLDSKSIKFQKLPQQITKLFHLRYVTLFVDDLNILPKPLSKLLNLETLVIDTKSRVITMEANIWRLIMLRHLKTNAAIVLASNKQRQGLAGENDLQTLTRLSPESCMKNVSKRARNLKSLGIQGDLEILFGKMFLERFQLLEKLKLIHDVFPSISSVNPLHQLPPPNSFPPNLKWLTLSQTHLLWDRDMPTLANIKTLEVLKLKDDAFTGVIWRESGDCFPCLKFFLIETTDLVIWRASTTSLPSLSCLVLKNCENLTEIPEAVARNLERLEIEHLGKSAVDSARRIADKKQQAQEKQNFDHPFKLYIGPGCH